MLSWATAYLLSEWAIRLAMLVYVPQRRTPTVLSYERPVLLIGVPNPPLSLERY